MLINTASLSSLYDMYKQNAMTPYNQEGQMIVTNAMWSKFWTIQTKTFNYLRTDGGEPFWKNVTLACLDLMDHVGSYMIGEFDCHFDKHLQQIWPNLIRAWYFGKVWLIKSEEAMHQEIAMAESEVYRNHVLEEKLFRGNPFRIFERYQSEHNKKYYFKSLLTGIDGFEFNPQEMIYLSLNEGVNFRRWWKINMEYISGVSRTVDALKALSKTVQVIVRNTETFKAEREQIENPSVFYELQRRTGALSSKEQNIYQEMPLIEGERIAAMKDIIESMYDKQAGRLGFTMNSNDKRERLTVAENYKDLRQITNIQDFQLKSLKVFEEKLRDRGWVAPNFRIEISGLTFGQGIPDTVQSGNPFVDKFGGPGPKQSAKNMEDALTTEQEKRWQKEVWG